MSFFDLTLLILMGGFVLYGLWFGLIHALGSFVGVVAGAFVAGQFYDAVAAGLLWMFGGNVSIARVVVFFVIFVIVNRLVGFGFHLIERAYKILSILPFLSSINRLAGAVLGFLEGSFVLGGVLLLATSLPFGSMIEGALWSSQIAPYLMSVAGILIPLLPELIQQAQDTVVEQLLP
jgi:uncharacterized membrane protein required for colicin V production